MTEDTAGTARGRRCAAPSFPVLRDTSVLQNWRTLSQAGGAGPAGCLVGAAGWDKARATTGAKLFLNRTREHPAGVAVVDSVSVPVEPLQNQ